MDAGKRYHVPDADDWRHPMRMCCICGVRDIPRGQDWLYWVNGMPAHMACCFGPYTNPTAPTSSTPER